MPVKKSTNLAVQGGNPLYRSGIAEDGTVAPNGPVKRGSADEKYVAAAADEHAVGICDIITTRGQKPGVALAAGDPCRVARGHFYFLATIAVSQTIVQDDYLACAGNNQFKKASALSVTVPGSGTAVTSDAAQPNLVEAGGVLPQGVVARAEESVTTDGATTAQILARWVVG